MGRRALHARVRFVGFPAAPAVARAARMLSRSFNDWLAIAARCSSCDDWRDLLNPDVAWRSGYRLLTRHVPIRCPVRAFSFPCLSVEPTRLMRSLSRHADALHHLVYFAMHSRRLS